MKNIKFLDIFFLCLGAIALMFGGKFGTLSYVVSAISLIFSAIVFLGARKKHSL